MTLHEFWSGIDPSLRAEFARRCGTSEGYLTNISNGKKCGIKIAVAIERESRGKVKRPDMRPDDWIDIWPELRAKYRHLVV